MAREKFSIFSILSLCLGVLLAAVTAPFAVIADYGERILSNFRPDASTSLALDSFARPLAVEPVPRSRFRAFVSRALSHPAFSGGGGFTLDERMPA